MSLRMDLLRRDFASLRTRVEAHLFHEVSAAAAAAYRKGAPPTWRRVRRQLAGAGW